MKNKKLLFVILICFFFHISYACPEFVELLSKNSELRELVKKNKGIVDFWGSYTKEGRDAINDNLDIWVKHLKSRDFLKKKKYTDVISIFGGVKVDSYVHKGVTYVVDGAPGSKVEDLIPDTKALDEALEIAARTDDVKKISKKMKISEKIIRDVKKHFFIDEHLMKTDRGFEIGRFERGAFENALWKGAENGFEGGIMWVDVFDGSEFPGSMTQDEAIENFKNLIAHEYVELSLMAKGLPFRSMDQPNKNLPYDFGAHDLAPSPTQGNYINFGIEANIPLPNSNLSNLDKIVNSYIKILAL